MKMFRSTALIEEVRKKRSLWDAAFKHPSERGIRAKQWLEVAEALHPNWNELNGYQRNESVQEVKSKWKNIRDYYRKGSKNWKGKKYVYSHLLGFLNENSIARKRVSLPINLDESEMPSTVSFKREVFEQQSISESDDRSNQEIILNENYSIDSIDLTPTTVQLENSKNHAQFDSKTDEEYDCDQGRSRKLKHDSNMECDDADKCFLLSILPEMRNLTGLQKIDFKMSVLNSLSNIMRERELQSFIIKEEPFS